MIVIALVAVSVVVLLDMLRVFAKSSVGGPMAFLLVFLVAMLAAGLYEAWSRGRGVVGWIASAIVALVGGLITLTSCGMLMEMIVQRLDLGEPLATSHTSLAFGASAAMMLLTLAGCWLALWLVSRLR